jgi:hypothetical protein
MKLIAPLVSITAHRTLVEHAAAQMQRRVQQRSPVDM